MLNISKLDVMLLEYFLGLHFLFPNLLVHLFRPVFSIAGVPPRHVKKNIKAVIAQSDDDEG